jgi:hypothetical protein
MYDPQNYNHKCFPGCIVNLLHHMGALRESNMVTEVMDMSVTEIASKFNIGPVPKSLGEQSHDKDIVLWFLRRKLRCEVLQLETHHFNTPKNCIDSLLSLNLPVVAGVKCHSTGVTSTHVMCFWQERIIDIEQQFTCELSIENIRRLCNAEFAGFLNAYAISPPKSMREHYHHDYKWGSCQHLQKSGRKSNKRKRKNR